MHAGVINVVYADGSVHSLSAGIQPAVWWSLCTPNGGEVVDANDVIDSDGEKK